MFPEISWCFSLKMKKIDLVSKSLELEKDIFWYCSFFSFTSFFNSFFLCNSKIFHRFNCFLKSFLTKPKSNLQTKIRFQTFIFLKKVFTMLQFVFYFYCKLTSYKYFAFYYVNNLMLSQFINIFLYSSFFSCFCFLEWRCFVSTLNFIV